MLLIDNVQLSCRILSGHSYLIHSGTPPCFAMPTEIKTETLGMYIKKRRVEEQVAASSEEQHLIKFIPYLPVSMAVE